MMLQILYKPGPDLFIADWMSQQSLEENKDSKICNIKINIDVIYTGEDLPECISTRLQ